jgi:hypothetical protein
MNTRQVKDLNLYLQKEEYVQGTVDWLVKDAEAWDSLCEHWASPTFVAKSERARQNQLSKRCTTMVQMDTFEKSKKWYDTRTHFMYYCI